MHSVAIKSKTKLLNMSIAKKNCESFKSGSVLNLTETFKHGCIILSEMAK